MASIVIRSAETYQVIREFPMKIANLAGWAPDGKSLLAVGWHERRYGAFRIGIDSGEMSPLVLDAPGPGAPHVCRLVSRRQESVPPSNLPRPAQSTLLRLDVPSGAEQELLGRPYLGPVFGFSLSPDGKYATVQSVDVASGTPGRCCSCPPQAANRAKRCGSIRSAGRSPTEFQRRSGFEYADVGAGQ